MKPVHVKYIHDASIECKEFFMHKQAHLKQYNRRQFLRLTALSSVLSLGLFHPLTSQALLINDQSKKLVEAARSQIGQTIYYNGNYVGLEYPNGDVPIETGVCTDVIIRAYRTAFNFDLQKAIHEDMKHNFSAYPNNWGATRTDRNIDHRRVPNQQAFFKRHGVSLPASTKSEDYQPGDIVSQMLPGNLPHILIVSDEKSLFNTPLAIHNIGRGAQEENILFNYKITGHYRFYPNNSNF